MCDLGIGPLPEHIASRSVEDGDLWELPPYEGIKPVDIHLLWNPQAKLNRAEAAFLAMLLAEVRSLPPDQRLPT